MPYDLELVYEQCNEAGLKSEFVESDQLVIKLAADVDLYFINSRNEQDCLITLGEGWHTHNHDFYFCGPHGDNVSIHYLDVIVGIAEGEILIRELWNCEKLKDRWLFHRDYNREFDYLAEGDEIRVRRTFTSI